MVMEEKTSESNNKFIPVTALMLDQLAKDNHHYQQKTARLETENKCLREQIQLLRSKHFGKSSEKLDPTMQSQLFDEVDLDELNPAGEPEEEELIEINYNRRKAKKDRSKYIDTSGLPHERQVMDLADKDKTCACGCELKKIGEDVREEIQCIPERFKVIEHVRPKYACPNCQTVKAAPALMLPLPKSKASSSLLAEIITNKYAYQLPLYRQAKLFEINGLKISDNTLGYLVMKSAELLLPLSDALWAQLPKLKRLQVDETPVKVLKPNTKAWMWVYHSYTQDNRFVIFDFSLSRSQVVTDQRLNNFSGLLQSDGYIGYENQRKRADIVSVGCWDHARRKFMDVIKASGQNKSGKAGQAIKLIAKLYEIEADLKHASYDERYPVRQLKPKFRS